MSHDAFDEDIEPGGLRDANEVKLLVCYLLGQVGTPLSLENLSDIVRSEGLVNYFELAHAVQELLKTGHIDLVEDTDGPRYKTTRLGAGTAAMFERSLPRSVREKALKAAVNLLSKIRRETENSVSITPGPGGGFEVEMRIMDAGDELMGVRVLLPEKGQAEMVKRNFLKKPEDVYSGLLALLTGDIGIIEGLLERRS